MAVVIGAEVVDALLLGVGGRRRELQDFPVLGDVWARFAEEPGKEQDLLFTPTWEQPAGEVAKLVATTDSDPTSDQEAYARNVAYLQALAVGKLSLDDLIAVALPATKWWDQINDKWGEDRYDDVVERKADEGRPTAKRIRPWIDWELEQALHEEGADGHLTAGPRSQDRLNMEIEDRQTAKLGLLIGILQAASRKDAKTASRPDTIRDAVSLLGRGAILKAGVRAIRLMIQRRRQFARTTAESGHTWNGLIFQVSLNRAASPAIAQSVGAIKGDAARSLFSISCKEIGWAVVDSGIDQTHPAFWDYEMIWKAQDKAAKDVEQGRTPDPPADPRPHRIRATFDFRRIRAIMSVEAVDHGKLVSEIEPQSKLDAPRIKALLEELAADRKMGKPVNWAKVQPLIEQKCPEAPPHPHGTHVAGIIGAHWVKAQPRQEPRRTDPVKMSGVCPDIGLYDFRVLGSDEVDSEFAVIAAMQFIRFLNDQSGYSLIHGANLSLSIPHNVRNYACGRTEVCIEAESLAANGVVIVAAAGNRGFQQYRLADNSMFESYAASSITDPGNAEGVITVGATHRHWPHTYGVSFFSSRGPTGDGRLKPDLLAPGERIESCIPGGRSDQMDGTSMAAPHVSGAAALLMARHQELQGQPARIKEILCATATDLKRERSFQGHGMVDVLRAIQSI